MTQIIYLTVNQIVKKYPWLTMGGVRHYIFHATTNGIDAHKVIMRIGRKILINETRFFEWLDSQQK